MRLIDPFPLLTDLIEMLYTDDDSSMVLTKVGEQIWNAAIECVASKVKEQTAIDAEPVRHGRWIDGRPYTNSRWKVCSECHKSAHHPAGGDAYCPHCGSKMDGGDPHD